ncbi:hypothetical protein RLV_0450 (plasmid) [Rhizobium leguminosarum bv. viciae]|nr:hypothetical protein RLV_0450 [Rhizobium leguminosarum bv. viciae]
MFGAHPILITRNVNFRYETIVLQPIFTGVRIQAAEGGTLPIGTFGRLAIFSRDQNEYATR